MGVSRRVLVVKNGMDGTILMQQVGHHLDRISVTRLKGPDYTALARSFGAHAETVTHANDFPAAFKRAQDAAGLALLELQVDPRQITPSMRLADDADVRTSVIL